MTKKMLLISALAFSASTQAAIVYTDINPDGLPTGEQFDFNNDGTAEFELSSFTNSGDYFDYSGGVQGTNIWAYGTGASGWDVPKPLSANTVIGAAGNWIGAGDASMDAWGAGTPFTANQDEYIGVTIVLNGETHYGWIRVMYDGTDFIYKDFAYEATPDTAIEAGDQGTGGGSAGIDRLTEVNVAMFPNPTSYILNLQFEDDFNSVVLIDQKGAVVLSKELKSDDESISVVDLPKGIYLVELIGKGLSYKSTIVIQ